MEFAPDDRSLTLNSEAETTLWKIGASNSYRAVDCGPEYMSGSSFSPSGRLLAVAGTGVRILDCATGGQIADLPAGELDTALFTPDQSGLVTCGTNGLQLWPVSREASRQDCLIGPSIQLEIGIAGKNRFCLSKDGNTVAAIHQSSHIHVVSLRGDRPSFTLKSQPGMSYAAISPDQRWVASGAWQGTGVKVWDTSTHKLIKELDIPDQATVTFSPDGQWLVTGSHKQYSFWSVGSWAQKRTIQRVVGSGWPGSIVFTADGRIAALTTTDTQVEIQEDHRLAGHECRWESSRIELFGR
jgi:WD40 repeat protein